MQGTLPGLHAIEKRSHNLQLQKPPAIYASAITCSPGSSPYFFISQKKKSFIDILYNLEVYQQVINYAEASSKFQSDFF